MKGTVMMMLIAWYDCDMVLMMHNSVLITLSLSSLKFLHHFVIRQRVSLAVQARSFIEMTTVPFVHPTTSSTSAAMDSM